MKDDTALDRHEHKFGSSPPLSLGVEEELLLVDEQCQLIAEGEVALERVAVATDRISTEIFAEQIELKTGICHGAADVLAELHELRRAVADAGFHILGAGLYPASSNEPTLVSSPRYEVVREDLGNLLKSPPCGLHVHVGIAEPDTAIRLANAFRRYLPALQALSANSPFQDGTDSGHDSARTQVVRSYPRFQVPREFRDYEDFCRIADELTAAAGVDDYTYIWWDVRPHPQLGTVEVRAVDVQMNAAGSSAIAALVQAIAAKELADPSDSGPSREALEEVLLPGREPRTRRRDPARLGGDRTGARCLQPHARFGAAVRARTRQRGGPGRDRADLARGQRSRRAAAGPSGRRDGGPAGHLANRSR